MKCVKFIIVFVALLYSVQGKEICDLADVECTNQGAQNTFNSLMAGIPGVIEPSDILRMEDSDGELPFFKYRMYNGTMTGLPNCHLANLKIYEENILTFQYRLLCPQLVIHHNGKVNGVLDYVELSGEGEFTVVLNDYVIYIKGSFDTEISEKDQKLYFRITHYVTEFEPKGEVTLEANGPLHYDKVKAEKARAYIVEHASHMEELMRVPVMESYMAVYMAKMDVFLRLTPAEDIFPA